MTVSVDLTSGTLNIFTFPRVLAQILKESKAGSLLLEKGPTQKTIYFDGGQPVYADSTETEESLAKFLEREGVVKSDVSQKALMLSAESRIPYPDALVKLKAVEPASLYEQIRKNLALKILDVFTWESGSFKFQEGEKQLEGITALKMNPVRLVLRGVETAFSPERIAREGRFSVTGAYRFSADPSFSTESLQLTAEEIKILNSLKVSRNVEDLVKTLRLTEDQVIRRMYAFHVLGLIREVQEGEEISLDELVGASLLQALKPVETPKPVSQVDPVTRELANEIAGDHLRLMALNYFELFGLAESATAVEIRNKFMDFAVRYSPSRFKSPELGEFRDRGEELFLRGVKAFGVLSDFDTKTKYLDKIKAERGKAGESGKKKAGESFKIQTKLLDASTQLEKALKLLKDKKYAQAIEFFQYCLDVDGTNPMYLAYMGWTTYQQSPERNAKTAEKILQKAAEVGTSAEASYYLAKLLQATARIDEAMPHFRKAVELSPKNIDMVRELRNLERVKK